MYPILQVIDFIALVFSLAIIARALLSWFQPDPYNPLVQMLIRFTEPILAPIRNMMPSGMGGMDISPIIAWFLIELVRRILHQILAG